MAVFLGFNAKLYNGASFSSYSDEVPNVKDLTLEFADDEADASIRGSSGYKMTEPTLRGATISFEMVYDTSDSDFTAIMAAYFARTSLFIAVADGPIATVGTWYFKAECKVFGFQKTEALGDIQKVAITLKPCYSSNIPTTVTVT